MPAFSGTTGLAKIYLGTTEITKAYLGTTLVYDAVTIIPIDDLYFKTVSLLLHMDGSNNGTVFTDNSVNLLTTTANGNAVTSTAIKKFGASSAYLDGSADWLETPNSASLQMGGSNFTVEAWIYLTAYAQNNSGYFAAIASKDADPALGGNTREYQFRLSGTASSYTTLSFIAYTNNTTAVTVSGTNTFQLNRWYHVAACRTGNRCFLFVDGALINSGAFTFNGTFQTTTRPLQIGRTEYGSGLDYYFPGYIDDLRISKFARYVQAFTPATEDFPDAGSDPYYSHVTLLLHMDGANNSTTFTDSSKHVRLATANANAIISTAQSKFGGASAYFDGTGDFISLASSWLSHLNSDFTIEFWVYIVTLKQSGIYASNTASFTTGSAAIILDHSTHNDQFGIWNNGSNASAVLCTTPTVTTGQWYHVAFVRSGTTLTPYLNGVASTPATTSANFTFETSGTEIGSYWGGDFHGYIDDFRVTKGIARYISNFTPPTAALPDFSIPVSDEYFSDVGLLLKFNGTNGSTTFTDESQNRFTVSPSGTATISTTQSMTGGSSLYVVSGGSVSVGANSVTAIGTRDFTIEFWVWIPPSSGWAGYPVNVGGAYMILFPESSTSIRWVEGITTTMAPSIGTQPTQTWMHIAISRQGSTRRLFKNGSLLASTTSGGATPTGGITVGGNGMTAYIDSFRYTVGYARYTSNFTVPGADLPAL